MAPMASIVAWRARIVSCLLAHKSASHGQHLASWWKPGGITIITTTLRDNIKHGKRYGPDSLDRGLEGTDRELPDGAQERFPCAAFGMLVETQGGISIVTTILRDNINCGKIYGPDGLDRGLEGTDRELPAGAQERFPWATFGILVETQGG